MFASTALLRDEESNVLLDGGALPRISGNSEVSGQKASISPIMCGFKGLTDGNMKKQLREKN